MTIKLRWHLRLSHQKANPGCLSPNSLWQVKDPWPSSHWLLTGVGVSVNVIYRESKLTVMSVKSSFLPLQPPPARVTRLVFIETAFSTASGGAVVPSPHYISTSKGQYASFPPLPRLWLTRWLWATIAAKTPRDRLNELTPAVWRHLAPNPLTTLLYKRLHIEWWDLEGDWCTALNGPVLPPYFRPSLKAWGLPTEKVLLLNRACHLRIFNLAQHRRN